jgi:hypothetical protein
MAEIMEVIWGKREGIYFAKGDWTGRNSLIRFDKFVFARTSVKRLYFTS